MVDKGSLRRLRVCFPASGSGHGLAAAVAEDASSPSPPFCQHQKTDVRGSQLAQCLAGPQSASAEPASAGLSCHTGCR